MSDAWTHLAHCSVSITLLNFSPEINQIPGPAFGLHSPDLTVYLVAEFQICLNQMFKCVRVAACDWLIDWLIAGAQNNNAPGQILSVLRAINDPNKSESRAWFVWLKQENMKWSLILNEFVFGVFWGALRLFTQTTQPHKTPIWHLRRARLADHLSCVPIFAFSFDSRETSLEGTEVYANTQNH